MATRRSARMTAQRRPRGYLKLESGLLDVTPLKVEEIAIGKRNSLESPLLRLPAEIREMIWTHAMSGHVIKPLTSISFGMFYIPSRTAGYFDLLTASRQIYHETAVLPCRLNIISFGCWGEYAKYRNMGKLKFMGKLVVDTRVSKPDAEAYNFNEWFPLEELPALEKVEITLCADWAEHGAEVQGRFEIALPSHLVGKKVTVRYAKYVAMWVARMRKID